MDAFELCISHIIKDVEARIGRAMTESQKQGLKNAGSLMFLEAMTNSFYCAKDDKEVESWLEGIDGFTRNV